MEITFKFPINYKHGQPSETEYYVETIFPLTCRPRNQGHLEDIFKDTKLYDKFRKLSFEPYVYWSLIGPNTYIAIPRIYVWYRMKLLKYLYIPTYKQIKLDFYLLTNENNDISDERISIIEGSKDGNHIVSLDQKGEVFDTEYRKNLSSRRFFR